jgi:hypothetical protein
MKAIPHDPELPTMEQIISPNSAIPRKGRALVPGGRLTREVLRSTLNPLVHSNEARNVADLLAFVLLLVARSN